ncbi:hypothetical protein LTR46_008468 [Exophiala xenobiotica]|nr:hypothetical protein LTR46_008468 [Exophiala xenobiotica]
MGINSARRKAFHQAAVLEDLGISSTIDEVGIERLTIDLDTNGSNGAISSRAEFDTSSGRWRIIPHHVATPAEKKPSDSILPKLPASTNPKGCWTDHLPRNEGSEWFLNGVDWSTTDYGPLEYWPTSLRTVVSLAMTDTAMDLNKRFSFGFEIQGKPFEEIWRGQWSDMEGIFNAIQAGDRPFEIPHMAIFPRQPDGHREETFWRGSLLPIRGANGYVVGWYNRASEVTNEILSERRQRTLYSISSQPSDPDTTIWHHVFQALRDNGPDFPMAFAYSADDGATSCRLTLQQTLGLLPGGHDLVPESLDVYEAPTGLLFYYRKVKSTHKPVILHKADGTLPEELLVGFDWQGYNESPISVAVLPLSVSSRLLGVIVLGLNPRRRYQQEDDAFINALCRQASAAIASAIDREEAQKHAEMMALQLEENERQIREIAEHAPVGMVRVTPSGNIIWANSEYYGISGHPQGDQYTFSFMEVIHEDDRAFAGGFWSMLVDEHKPVSQEFRLQRKWTPPPTAGDPSPKDEHRWIIANAFPVFANGVLSNIVACITDISRIKWTEEIQSRLAIEATEARKLQEAFIDVVSHEMRNPLSAITQLADGIAACVDDWNSMDDHSMESAIQLLKENVENGKTILLCASHQKRVIDDVLTLSKLDSQLLSISPDVVQPHTVVDSALNMFKAEFDTNSITVENGADDSYARLNLDWVCLDPARLTQIFINLLTNAIKFTKLEPERKIKVQRRAFISLPPPLEDIIWFPTNKDRRDATTGSEWGTGDPIYLLFTITDTGKGLGLEEMTRLFNRFQQATKKTHIKYGGSGLGLFISRELTENMGGQIGVTSAPGKGSTFAFYIQARKADPPRDQTQTLQPSEPPIRVPSPFASHEMSQITRLPSKEHAINTTPARVLLVEDNIINAQVLMKQLKRAGCTVYIANHGQEALDFLPRTRAWHNYEPLQVVDSPSASLDVDIDCILMDVEMPVLDGLSCTRQIRVLQKDGLLTKHIHIIAITANARSEQIDSALEAGVDAVLPKPFRAVDVLKKMDEVMNTDAGNGC